MEGEDHEYTTISISTQLATKIDGTLARGGYQNRADFVRDAIRRLLTELENKAVAELSSKTA